MYTALTPPHGAPAITPVRETLEARNCYTVLLPVVDLIQAQHLLPLAAAIARRHDGEVVVLGCVAAPSDQTLADRMQQARYERAALYRAFAGLTSTHTPVRVAVRMADDIDQVIRAAVAESSAQLLLMGWQAAQASPERFFGAPLDSLLRRPPCDVAVVKLADLGWCHTILLPVRGGPHTALAAEIASAVAAGCAATVTVLYADDHRQEDHTVARASLEYLRANPYITQWIDTQASIQQAMLAAPEHQLIVIGVTGRQGDPEAPIGPVAEHVLRHAKKTVLLVCHKLERQEAQAQEAWQQRRDQSALVDSWFADNTFSAAEFEDLQRLVALKRQQGLTISLALPTLNEEQTLGDIITAIKHHLVDEFPLLDELVVIDSRSTDRTQAIARELGIPVYVHQDILPQYGTFHGKGEALWKSLHVLQGDLIAWIDTDIKNIHPRFVYGILGPLLYDPQLVYCKGFYRRPMLDQDQLKATGGGRVTELTARPLLNLFYPELSGMVQPLSGEYAGRRSILERLPFFTGYGVEIGLLIDLLEHYGLRALAQADLTQRVHRNQELPSLSQMAFAIMQVVLQRVERRGHVQIMDAIHQSMKLIHTTPDDRFQLEVREIRDHERPPMISIPEYQRRRVGSSAG